MDRWAMLAAMLALGACAASEPGAIRERTASRAVAPGAETRLGTHADIDALCGAGGQPAIEIVAGGALGTTRAEPAAQTVVQPGSVCDGRRVEGVAVIYAARPDATGVDEVVYLRLREGGPADRWTVTVTVGP